jgi:hypothetical protein
MLREDGMGDVIAVRINLVGVNERGASEEVVRSASRGPLAVVQSVNGGILMEMAIEEDGTGLRAASPVDLGMDAKFRVIVLRNGDLQEWVDCTVGGDYPWIYVTSGVAYDFVCVSYNDGTLPPTTGYVLGQPLPDLTLDGTRDLLWQKQGNKQITAANNTLDFVLNQQWAKVRLIVDCTFESRIIEDISATFPITMSLSDEGVFDYRTGVVTPASSSVAAEWAAGNAGSVWTSGEMRVLPRASAALTVTVPAGAVRLAGNKVIPPANQSIVFPAAPLDAEKSYTFRVRMMILSTHFAGSNIYWDQTLNAGAGALTFKPYGDKTNEKYQGVFFQFGSLVGISPAGNFGVSTTDLYVPAYNASTQTSTWNKTNAGNHGWTWTTLPYITTGTADSRTNFQVIDAAQNTPAMWGDYQGDICQYITKTQSFSGNYRLPVSIEFGASTSGWPNTFSKGQWQQVNVNGWPVINTNQADGTQIINDGANFVRTADGRVIFFPAAGIRDSAAGAQYNSGKTGYYRSGSTDAAGGYYLDINATVVYPGGFSSPSPRQRGYSVRCILQE